MAWEEGGGGEGGGHCGVRVDFGLLQEGGVSMLEVQVTRLCARRLVLLSTMLLRPKNSFSRERKEEGGGRGGL